MSSAGANIPGKGALIFTFGLLLTNIVFYPFGKTVLIGAILTVTFGDGLSTLVGKLFGKRQIMKNRTLEGTLAGMIAAAIALSFIVPIHIAIITAIVGLLAEYIPLNDNYTIPIAAGFCLALLL